MSANATDLPHTGQTTKREPVIILNTINTSPFVFTSHRDGMNDLNYSTSFTISSTVQYGQASANASACKTPDLPPFQVHARACRRCTETVDFPEGSVLCYSSIGVLPIRLEKDLRAAVYAHPGTGIQQLEVCI